MRVESAESFNGARHKGGKILYTEDVEVQHREGIVGERGELLVAGLPFEPGQAVEVFVVLKAALSLKTQSQTVRGSVLEYRDPLDPVASEAWDVLR